MDEHLVYELMLPAGREQEYSGTVIVDAKGAHRIVGMQAGVVPAP